MSSRSLPVFSEKEKRFDENAASRHFGKKYGTFAAMATSRA
jgi:hypothetical protein